MAERQEHQPGTHAPVTGRYEELNVFGTPTGRVEHVRECERLSPGPRGFTWRQIEEEGCWNVTSGPDRSRRRFAQ